MNVAQMINSGNSDGVSKTGRQDRDNASKRGDKGFSDTLGSFDRQGSSSSSSSSNTQAAPAKPSAASSSASSASSTQTSASSNAQAPSQGQPQAQSQSASTDKGTPAQAPAPSGSATNIVSNSLFLNAAMTQGAQVPAPVPTDTSAMAPPAHAMPDAMAQLPDMSADAAVLPEMSDLAKLVTALSKTVGASASSQADTVSGDAEETSDTDADADAATSDTTGEGMDLLSLLAATTAPVDQGAKTDAKGNEAALGGVMTGGAGTQPATDTATATTTVVRLQKQDAPAIDFHMETQEDGSTKLDVSKAMGDASDVVQVVESRRFVGMAPTSNAAAISSAMATDPEWATAMAGQTSNSPMISSTGQVVHVLKIQMTPVELGHVTAAMKLVGDELSVQLTAHTLKGYSELQKDSSSILDALKSQGFTVDQVTVTLANNADRQDSSTGNRQPADQGQQGAQQGQRGSDNRPQEQFYRQPARGGREETISHEITSQPEIPSRTTSARPDHVYL